MKTNLVNPANQSALETVRCPQCETVSSKPTGQGRATCPQCGSRFCPECHYYRRRLGTDFCLACGITFAETPGRRMPVLPGYLEQHVSRSVSLVNLWFLAWLTLTISGGPVWLYVAICGTLSLYWLIHFWRFRQRTGLVHASRYIGGIGLSVILTLVALTLLQLWLIRPPVEWQSIDLWAFILVAMLIVPLGVLGPPAIMQSQSGKDIANEANTYAARWAVLERMRYRDTLLLRIPNVRHLPAIPQRQDDVRRSA
jgi:hypothetical protein